MEMLVCLLLSIEGIHFSRNYFQGIFKITTKFLEIQSLFKQMKHFVDGSFNKSFNFFNFTVSDKYFPMFPKVFLRKVCSMHDSFTIISGTEFKNFIFLRPENNECLVNIRTSFHLEVNIVRSQAGDLDNINFGDAMTNASWWQN